MLKWLGEKIKRIYAQSANKKLDEARQQDSLNAYIALTELNYKSPAEWIKFQDHIQTEFTEHVIAALNAIDWQIDGKEDVGTAVAHLRIALYGYKMFIATQFPHLTLQNKLKTSKPGGVGDSEQPDSSDASESQTIRIA